MSLRVRCRRALVAGVLACTAAGCRASAIYVPAVRMQVAVQPVEVHAGDSVRISATITNPRPDTVLLEFGKYCRVSFTVLDAADRPISPENANSHCMHSAGGRLVLAPGASWSAAGAWRASRENGEPVPPGRYTVAAVLGDHDSTVRGKREYKMGSGANRVRIQVLPPRP